MVTAEELKALEDQLLVIKESGSDDERSVAMQAVADMRREFRLQEETAGRRNGLVGGDAVNS